MNPTHELSCPSTPCGSKTDLWATGHSVWAAVETAMFPEQGGCVNRFRVYRDRPNQATELQPIPIMVAGGYYGNRVPVRFAVELDDPVELLRRVVAALASLPATSRFLARPARECEAVTSDARLADLQTAIRLLKRPTPAAFTPFTAGPIDKWTARLEGFAGLKKGWDSYRADPPSPAVLREADEFLDAIRKDGKEPSKLNPAVVGGVGFTFRNGSRSVYIEFRNTGNVHAAFIGAGPEPDVVKVTKGTAGYAAVLARVEKHLHEQAARGHENERPAT